MIKDHFGTSRRIWIGLNDIERENTWVWENGERLLSSDADWMPGQPDNFAGAEDCVEMYQYQGWNDLPCDYAVPVPLCEMSVFDA